MSNITTEQHIKDLPSRTENQPTCIEVEDYTIVIVTHNMQQAGRCSDLTAFLYLGKIIEVADTNDLFDNPKEKQTEDYISGRFG